MGTSSSRKSHAARNGALLLILNVVALALVSFWAPPASAAPGDEHWSDVFGYPGVGGSVYALQVIGPDLIVGGNFGVAGYTGANGIARWNGFNFSSMGSGVDGVVRAVATYNGQIIAAGSFTTAGGITVNNIARWNGSSWQPLGGGLTGSYPVIYALAVYGSDLIAAGSFSSAEGQPASNIARWDGSAWHQLGTGLTGDASTKVNALVVYDGLMIAGGTFTAAGGILANQVAAWDGSAWDAMGAGTSVDALTVFNGELFAHGTYTGSKFARWDGSSWLNVNDAGATRAFAVLNGQLVAGGGLYGYDPGNSCCFSNHLGAWDGSTWSQLDPGTIGGFDGFNGYVNALAIYNGELIVGGGFDMASGSVRASGIARWTGTSIEPLYPMATNGVDYTVAASTLSPDGLALIVGGAFYRPGDIVGRYVASWTGSMWENFEMPGPLVNGRVDGRPTVGSLAVYNGAIIAGGAFNAPISASEYTVNIAAWNGGWSKLGNQIIGCVEAMTVYNNELIAGGCSSYLKRWNGSSWQTFGNTIGGSGSFIPITALAVYRGDLIAAGSFTSIGGISAQNIARWSNGWWYPLGAGIAGQVNALYVSGPNLYVGGQFTEAGGIPATGGIAVWNGATGTWTALGSGLSSPAYGGPTVNAITSFNGTIIAGGSFDGAGGSSVRNIARWDGTQWLAMGSGVNGTVRTMTVFNGLVVGGTFSEAGGRLSNNLAIWNDTAVSGAPEPTPRQLRVALNPVTPNPSNGRIMISFMVPAGSPASLDIFDVQGRAVRSLIDFQHQIGGTGTISWDGRDESGRTVGSGTYLVRLESPFGTEVRKFAIAR